MKSIFVNTCVRVCIHMCVCIIFNPGCVPNVQRAALVNLGDLTAYDQTKTFLVLRGMDPDSKVFF